MTKRKKWWTATQPKKSKLTWRHCRGQQHSRKDATGHVTCLTCTKTVKLTKHGNMEVHTWGKAPQPRIVSGGLPGQGKRR